MGPDTVETCLHRSVLGLALGVSIILTVHYSQDLRSGFSINSIERVLTDGIGATAVPFLCMNQCEIVHNDTN